MCSLLVKRLSLAILIVLPLRATAAGVFFASTQPDHWHYTRQPAQLEEAQEALSWREPHAWNNTQLAWRVNRTTRPLAGSHDT